MDKADHRQFPGFIIPALPGCLMVGVITFVCYELRLNLNITGFLFLMVVVLQSLTGNFASSALVSLVAVACLDFFFVPPVLSFEVSNPLDILALLSFLITGLVITRLTTRVGKEVATSDRQRLQFNQLYELAQQLLALDPDDAILTQSVERFRDVFRLDAMCLFDAVDADCYTSGNTRIALHDKTRAACGSGRASDDLTQGVLIRCLEAAGKTIGAVGFEGLYDAELTIGPLSALAAAMLERVHAFRTAGQAAAAADAEAIRGAILDALAHEFKTPLATILTAAGGLGEVGPLCDEQLELAEIVETEAARLGELTSRVLRTGQLDEEQLKPRLDRTDMVALVVNLVEQYSQGCVDRKFYVARGTSSTEVLADRDLLQLALRQLLDNACKYSPPGSAVTVTLEPNNEQAMVRVLNRGNLILANERTRIFDRFYRGAQTRRQVPGSGLGLYFAHKIVQAHGGSMELEDESEAAGEGTSFRLTLPLAKIEMVRIKSDVD